MDKVKIFYGLNNINNGNSVMEKEINDWFALNKNIDVINIRSTQSGRLDCHYSVIIHYR